MDADYQDDLAIALNASPLVTQEAACRLAAVTETWLEADLDQLQAIAEQLRVPVRSVRYARECARTARHLASRERGRARHLGAEIVTRHHPAYPSSLFDLELPPPALYVLGELPSRPAVAIVGSRKSDPYGLEAAQRFAGELAERGITIISGLALGVDSAAHRAALSVGGTTVAVLGCGLDIDYPRSNRRLRAQIVETGAIVSEFPVGTPPEAHHFPIRNRIIAALGCGTLVVRGTPRSGSLITAGCALTLGRQVWAIPGNIFDPRSMGPNSLIRDGAHPVQSPAELLETLATSVQLEIETLCGEGGRPEPRLERTDLAKLFQAIPAGEIVDAPALLASTGLTLDQILSLLSELEIMGFVTRYPGPVWGRCGCGPDGGGK